MLSSIVGRAVYVVIKFNHVEESWEACKAFERNEEAIEFTEENPLPKPWWNYQIDELFVE